MPKQTMKRISIVVCVLIALPVAPVWAVNKCVSQDGSISYQTAPCPTGANATEIQRLPTNGPPSNPGEVDRIKGFTEKSAKDRRLLEIERAVTQSQDRIASYRQEMSDQIDALRSRKHAASNNLAGATWEQSISEEMSAISQQFNVLIRSEQDRIAGLRDEAKSLRETK
jgi:hypothetical protein